MKTKLTARLLGWAGRRETANLVKRSSRGDAAGDPNGAGFSHRLLDAAGIKLIPDEDVLSSLWCVRRRSSFVLTNRRIIYAQKEGRGVTAHWSELSEVKNAGVTKVGRNNPLLAAGVSCWLVGGMGFWSLAPFLVFGGRIERRLVVIRRKRHRVRQLGRTADERGNKQKGPAEGLGIREPVV